MKVKDLVIDVTNILQRINTFLTKDSKSIALFDRDYFSALVDERLIELYTELGRTIVLPDYQYIKNELIKNFDNNRQRT